MQDQRKTIFGIDLGTTYTCIAYVDEFGKAVIVPNMEGDRTTPSVIFFENAQNRVVGKIAKENALLYPDAVVEMVKRHMGEQDWLYTFDGVEYRAEEISSYILRKVVGDAEAALNCTIQDVVITCPAYFGINEKGATKRAGELAGLNVRHILEEPTAAAISYGLTIEEDKVILVYDLGGGTFDITMLEKKEDNLRVIATDGNHQLGGRNWDQAIVNYIAEQWMADAASNDDPRDDRETLQDLWNRIENAKKYLSKRDEVDIAVTHAGHRQRVTLNRAKFEELTAHLLEDTIQYTRHMLEEAEKKGYHRFDEFLLVGGSSYMPQVTERIRREFGVEPRLFDPDEAVAKGAALLGQKLAIDDDIEKVLPGMGIDDWEGVSDAQRQKVIEEVADLYGLPSEQVARQSALKIQIVTSHSFGVVVVKGGSDEEFVNNLIIKNTVLPVEVVQRFGTRRANQENADIRIMENILSDEEVDLEMSEEIGKTMLELPSGLAVGSPIEITFLLNEQGLLSITAREITANRSADTSVQTNRVISEEEFEEAKKRSAQITVR